ncbi:MAG TPA: hypothetical protein VFA74_16530 [Terriglobales bacterium]|nr:hypothetical protein [Terriglobales bacterium]
MKKWKLDRIISIATLATSVIALVLVLKKPAPVAQPQSPAVAAVNAQSFDQKIQKLDQPKEPGQAPAEVHLNSDEVSAALAQAVGALQASATASHSTQAPSSRALPNQTSSSKSSSDVSTTDQTGSGLLNSLPSSADAAIASGEPDVKDYQVNFDGDLAKGQFLTQVAGKAVWVTLAGHLGSKDGYATFDPTEFKVGDLSVPVSLVNDALQKKLAEQRDRLKLPNDVGGIKVENGELVLTQK